MGKLTGVPEPRTRTEQDYGGENVPRIKISDGRIPQPTPTMSPTPVATPAPTATTEEKPKPKINFESLVDKTKKVIGTATLSDEARQDLEVSLERAKQIGTSESTTGGTSAAAHETGLRELEDILARVDRAAVMSGNTAKADEVKSVQEEVQEARKNFEDENSQEENSHSESQGQSSDTAGTETSDNQDVDDVSQWEIPSGDDGKPKPDIPLTEEETAEAARSSQLDWEAKKEAERKKQEEEDAKPQWRTEGIANLLNQVHGAKNNSPEEQKKSKSSMLLNILGGALLTGGLGAAGYYLMNKGKKGEDEAIAKEKEKIFSDAQAELNKKPEDPVKQSEAQSALNDLIHTQRRHVLDEAIRTLRHDKEERIKAANDIGLNFGNFSKIFGSHVNHDAVNSASDLTHLLNIQSRGLNKY